MRQLLGQAVAMVVVGVGTLAARVEANPTDVLKDTTKVWRFEVVNGRTISTLAKVKDAPNVWCSVKDAQRSATSTTGRCRARTTASPSLAIDRSVAASA